MSKPDNKEWYVLELIMGIADYYAEKNDSEWYRVLSAYVEEHIKQKWGK